MEIKQINAAKPPKGAHCRERSGVRKGNGMQQAKAGDRAAVQEPGCATNGSTDRWARRRKEPRYWEGRGANGDDPCTPEMNWRINKMSLWPKFGIGN